MGDVPYDVFKEEVLINQITEMTNNLHLGATFLVHIQDIMRGLQTN
jgi:hypothetical protein